MDKSKRRKKAGTHPVQGRPKPPGFPAPGELTSSIAKLQQEVMELLKGAPLDTGNWTGDAGTFREGGGATVVLQLLANAEAAHYRTVHGLELPGMSGLFIHMEGGAAVAIISHDDKEVVLDVPNQVLANAVLFTLMGGNFLPRTIPKQWGDVTEIVSFRMTNHPAGLVFRFEELWPG